MGKRKPKNRSRVVIETPLKAPETQAEHTRKKLGVVDPFSRQWKGQEFKLSHPLLSKA